MIGFNAETSHFSVVGQEDVDMADDEGYETDSSLMEDIRRSEKVSAKPLSPDFAAYLQTEYGVSR